MSPRSADAATPLPAATVPAIVTALFAFQLYAFHWGVVTPDTVFQWGQALADRYDDWHPPATAWLWRQLMPLGPGTAPVLVFDCLLYWCGVALLAEMLRRRGQRWSVAAILLMAASPIAFGQMGAILKDPLLAATCLLASALLLARGTAAGRRAGLLAAVAAVLLVYASALRINALFATVPLLVAAAPPGWTTRPLRLAVTAAGAGAMLFAGAWAIDSVALRPHRSQPIFSLVNFDLAGLVAHGDATAYPGWAPATARRMTALCYTSGQYNPTYSDDCDTVEDDLRTRTAAQGSSAVRVWLGAIAAHPIAYLEHRLAHANRNWRFLVDRVPDDAVYEMTTANPYGLSFVGNAASRAIGSAARWLAWSPLGRPATWLAVAIGLLILAPHVASRRMVTALAVSALSYGGAYAVVSVAPDLRYNLWTMLASATALIVATGDIRAGVPRRTLLLAAAPVLIVLAGEMIALLVA